MGTDLDIKAVLEESKRFYKAHGLDPWVKALPFSASFSAAETQLLQRADELELHQAFCFPDFETQMRLIRSVIEETAYRPLGGLPADPRFSRSYISDDWGKEPTGRVYQRATGMGSRQEGPYLLRYDLNSVRARTGSMTGHKIKRRFERRKWNGFTVPEFLITSRAWREHQVSRGMHTTASFEEYLWSWLVDSGEGGYCSAAYLGLQTIGVFGCDMRRAEAQWGAHAAVIVPLR